MGPFLVVLSSLGFATLGIFGKLAFDAGLHRNEALFLRFLVAFPLMVILSMLGRGRVPARGKLLAALGLGAVGIGVEASLFFFTLERLGAALTGVFLYLYPSFVAVGSHFFLGTRLTRKKALAVGVALLGSVLTAGMVGTAASGIRSPIEDPIGLLGGVLTGAWYAVYILVGNRVTRDSDPLWVSTGVVLGSLLVFGVLMMINEGRMALPSMKSSEAVTAVAGLAVLATVLPFSTLYAGMKRVGAVKASLLSTSELVFTLVLASGVLGEKLSGYQWLGSTLIFISVLIEAYAD